MNKEYFMGEWYAYKIWKDDGQAWYPCKLDLTLVKVCIWDVHDCTDKMISLENDRRRTVKIRFSVSVKTLSKHLFSSSGDRRFE